MFEICSVKVYKYSIILNALNIGAIMAYIITLSQYLIDKSLCYKHYK